MDDNEVKITEVRYQNLLLKEQELGRIAGDLQQLVTDFVPKSHLYAGQDLVDVLRDHLKKAALFGLPMK